MDSVRPEPTPEDLTSRQKVAALIQGASGLVRGTLAQAPLAGRPVVEAIQIALVRAIAEARGLDLPHEKARGVLPFLMDGSDRDADCTGLLGSIRGLGRDQDGYLASALTERIGWNAYRLFVEEVPGRAPAAPMGIHPRRDPLP